MASVSACTAAGGMGPLRMMNASLAACSDCSWDRAGLLCHAACHTLLLTSTGTAVAAITAAAGAAAALWHGLQLLPAEGCYQRGMPPPCAAAWQLKLGCAPLAFATPPGACCAAWAQVRDVNTSAATFCCHCNKLHLKTTGVFLVDTNVKVPIAVVQQLLRCVLSHAAMCTALACTQPAICCAIRCTSLCVCGCQRLRCVPDSLQQLQRMQGAT